MRQFRVVELPAALTVQQLLLLLRLGQLTLSVGRHFDLVLPYAALDVGPPAH